MSASSSPLFADLIGQSLAVNLLEAALRTQRLAPAYLFAGPDGVGRRIAALRFLEGVLSGGAGSDRQRRRLEAGNHPDLLWVEPTFQHQGRLLTRAEAEEAGVSRRTPPQLRLEQIRAVSRFLGRQPVEAQRGMVVIEAAEAMPEAAANALLKTLEEPPPQVVFILATTDPQRVLPTILSRCQRFDFRRIPLQALEQHLGWIAEQEAINITPEAVHLVAQLAQGGLRDAESLLDQLSLLPPPVEPDAVWELLGAVPEQELLQLAGALQAADPLDLLQSCRQLLDRGREPTAVLQGLAGLLRDLVLALAAPQHLELTGFSPANREALPALAQQLGRARLLRWQEGLRGSEVQLRQSAQPRLWLEVLLLGLLAEPQAAAIAAAWDVCALARWWETVGAG